MANDNKLMMINYFYKNLNYYGFKTINSERKNYLNEIIISYYNDLYSNNIKETMYKTILWLYTNAKKLNIKNGDEFAYIYINIVDPRLLFLEVHEIANTKEEEKGFSLNNFGIYDPALIKIEMKFNEKFKLYNLDELWEYNRTTRGFY